MKKIQTQNYWKGLLALIIFFPFYSCNNLSREIQNTDTEVASYSLNNKKAVIYLTAERTSQRLSRQKEIEFKELIQPEESFPTIMIDPNKRFQTIVGFGGALTDAAAETFYKLPESRQKEILNAYFNIESGIGYSLCRTSIHSCDFSSESFTYAEVPDDTLLNNYSINHDKEFRLPLIKEAISATGNSLKIFASPWSPPAWMKTNNNMLQGGKLKPEFYKTWANYYIRFLDEYKKEGISIWGLTVQNEPMAVQIWESCIYTAEEEKDFVKNYLGPAIKNSDFSDTKLMIWDHNRGIMIQRAKEIYDDPEASKYVWGTAFHWYVGNHFENVKLHQEAFPDKKMLFTEGCVAPFNMDSINLWCWGEEYGESIIHDLNNGAVGWVDWNILLDETGGPNHVNNFCFAPIIGNTKNGEIHYMNSFYYLGHFSKFIRPGAQRIICSSNDDDLLATAFLNQDNSVAIVVLNLKNNDQTFKTWINKKAFETESPAHSILTIVIK